MSDDLVSLALLIRQGQLKLRDVPAKLQASVYAVLQTLTDAQESTILHARENRQLPRARVGVFQKATS